MTTDDGEPGSLPEALQLVEAARVLVTEQSRDDLDARLQATQRRASHRSLRVLVVGEYKQGKSSLINALLDAQVCPVADDIATSIPTIVEYAATPRATAYLDSPAGEGTLEAVPIDVGNLPAYVTEDGDVAASEPVRAVVVGVPRELLAGGLELGDTPGVGGLGSAHTAVTMGALSQAEALVFVSDASQEYTEPELAFLRRAHQLCPTVLCVLSKTDLHPHWRRIRDRDQHHLREAGIRATLLPVSSVLRQVAVRTQDHDVNAESGFPPLVQWLGDLRHDAERVLGRAVANDVLAVCDQLAAPLLAEHRALADPASAAALVLELTAARERTDRVRGSAAGWQQTLNDGIADLSSDAEHDLRERLRHVGREATEMVATADPGRVWDEFAHWLTRRVAAESADSYARLAEAATALASRLATQLEQDEAELQLAFGAGPDATLADVQLRAGPTRERSGPAETGLAAVRGAYGSVLMLGMLGRMVGLAAVVANPLTAVGTVVLGGKAVKDHRARQLAGRRQQANQAIRQYIDDVGFQVGKDLRDTLRRVHRELRDTFTARAEERHRSASEGLAAAQRAVEADVAGRQERMRTLETSLARIRATTQQAGMFLPDIRMSTAVGP